MMNILIFSLINYLQSESGDLSTYAFDFNCLPKEKQDTPEAQSTTKQYKVVITIVRSLKSIWRNKCGHGNDDLIKVIYWYAHEALNQNPHMIQQEINLNTGNTTLDCPYDPKVIKFPPDPWEIEITKKIGF
jgi:hypothetical protein